MSLAPPFNAESALRKVKIAQDLWNTTDAARVAAAYTADTVWRNRDEFMNGQKEVEAFLERKWAKEKNYRLRKELFAFKDNKIAVEFWYEYTETEDEQGQWYRTYGLEHWVFNEEGKMKSRQMSGNTMTIKHEERWFLDKAKVNEGDVPKGHISAAI